MILLDQNQGVFAINGNIGSGSVLVSTKFPASMQVWQEVWSKVRLIGQESFLESFGGVPADLASHEVVNTVLALYFKSFSRGLHR